MPHSPIPRPARSLALASVAALGLAPLPAAAQSQAELNSFFAAVTQVSCRLDERTAPAVQAATRLSDQALSAIMVKLFTEGGARADSNGVVVITAGPCAG